jgi:hypothetical protein
MLAALIPLLGGVLDKLFPDAQKNAEAKQRLLELQINGELQQLLGQLDINKEEAKSSSVFVAGWRPAVGWVCVSGLAYNFVVYPLLLWVSARWYPGFEPPPLMTDNLMELIGGMLGLGGLRTFEKIKGVAK